MGLSDDVKETAKAGVTKAQRGVHDAADRAKDKADELTADAKVRGAEAERESVDRRNEAKEHLRNS